MSQKVFIHCGAPKTGTSYLQVLFARYCEELEKNGIIYPRNSFHDAARSGEITSGNGIEMANYINPSLPHKIEDKDAFPGILNEEMQKAGGKNILYSSEFISFSDQDRSNVVCKTILDAGYSPHVIYCVRDFGPAAVSSYSQLIKRHGETRTFAEFLKSWDPHYMWNLKAIIRTFGEEAVSVYNYEEQKGRLSRLFFVDILGSDFCPSDEVRINRSLTLKELELLRLMNLQYPENRKVGLSTFVSDALMKIDKTDTLFLLRPEHFEEIKARFVPAMTMVNSLVKGRGVKICDRVESKDNSVSVNDFEASVMSILAKVVVQMNK